MHSCIEPLSTRPSHCAPPPPPGRPGLTPTAATSFPYSGSTWATASTSPTGSRGTSTTRTTCTSLSQVLGAWDLSPPPPFDAMGLMLGEQLCLTLAAPGGTYWSLVVSCRFIGGTTIDTKTTRRSQADALQESRTETSEFFRQVRFLRRHSRGSPHGEAFE